jgi:hypothetical protein
MGGSNVIIEELDSRNEHTFVMKSGRLDGSACRLESSGEVADSETCTAYVGRYATQPLEHGAISIGAGTGETDETFLRADFVADPFDPWAGETQVVTIGPSQ